MHELSITRNIVAIVSERARGRRVERVVLQVGRLSGIEVEAIRFCYPICAEGTELAEAKLEVEEIDGQATCQGCQAHLRVSAPVGQCPCPRRAPIRIDAGEELLVKAMEVY